MIRAIFGLGKMCLITLILFSGTSGFGQDQQDQLEDLLEQAEQTPGQQAEQALITLDFEDADIRDVIRVIAMASGMNMVIGQNVEAKVTIALKDVPWERALDVVLRTYNFTYKKEANLIRIMTFEKVKQEERDIPLITKIVYLNFASVGEIQNPLSAMLSERGAIQTDPRTNSMLITDIPTKVEEVEKIAKKLDTRTPQVLIEAMLVDVKLTKEDELGINWKIIHVDRPEDQWAAESPNYIEQPATLMQENISAAIKLGWVKNFGGYDLSGLIQAWVSDAKANILASPKIVTLDNKTAKIEIKSQVAYTQITQSDQGGGTTSTQFKDVVTSLEVTPHITKEGFVSMNVKPKQEFVEGTVGGEPQIGSRSAETNVLVEDGETIVIGGLRKVEDNATFDKIPILGDIPILGHLFRKKDINRVNTELVMFVTPHVIIHPVLTDEEIDRFQLLDEAREGFLREQEKERIKRLKKSRRQARLIKPEIAEEAIFPDQEVLEAIEVPALPDIKEEQMQPGLENDKGYIYSW